MVGYEEVFGAGGRERAGGAGGCLLFRVLRVSGVCGAILKSEDRMRTAPETSPSDIFTSIRRFRFFISSVPSISFDCVGALDDPAMKRCGVSGTRTSTQKEATCFLTIVVREYFLRFLVTTGPPPSTLSMAGRSSKLGGAAENVTNFRQAGRYTEAVQPVSPGDPDTLTHLSRVWARAVAVSILAPLGMWRSPLTGIRRWAWH